jgi:hypothetical protein
MQAEVQLLDEVFIDESREFIEFRFSDTGGTRRSVQIDFAYCESLAAVFQQAFVSASLAAEQGANKALGQEWLAVPRADVDHPVSVGVDAMSGRVVAMFLLGTPFQVCYAMPRAVADVLSRDLTRAAEDAVSAANMTKN